MIPNKDLLKQEKSFWSQVKLISMTLGYSSKKNQIKRVFSIISGKTTMTKLGKCRKFQASNNWSRKGITKIRVKLYAKHENNTKGNHIRPCTSAAAFWPHFV